VPCTVRGVHKKKSDSEETKEQLALFQPLAQLTSVPRAVEGFSNLTEITGCLILYIYVINLKVDLSGIRC
jgi:hypothetical protein